MTLMTLSETAERLRVSKVRLWQLTASGELPSISIGRRRLIDEADFDRFVDSHREGRSSAEAR